MVRRTAIYLGPLDTEDEGTMVVGSIRNCLPVDTVFTSHTALVLKCVVI